MNIIEKLIFESLINEPIINEMALSKDDSGESESRVSSRGGSRSPDRSKTDDIIKLYNSGLKVRDISERLNININIVKKIIREEKDKGVLTGRNRTKYFPKISRSPRLRNVDKYYKIEKMRGGGKTLQEIADHFNVSRQAIFSLIKYHKNKEINS